MTMEKPCNKCGLIKDLEDFGRRSDAVDGRRNECKSCRAINDKRLYPKYRKTNKDGHLKRKYNLTIQEYETMHAAQKGLCCICHKPETRTMNGRISDLVVDHAHDSKQVRGLLCQKCNSGLGMFKDSIDLLEKAAKYLKEVQDNGLFERRTKL